MPSRSYGLDQDESVPDGVRRIAYGRIDHALDELNGSTDSSPEDAVHSARKDMKKLRALLRLLRGALGGKLYRREAAVFRDAARELSGVRDADVMLATLDGLELDETQAGPLRQSVEAHRLRTTAGSRGPAAAAAVEMLTEARGRVATWPLEADGFDAVGEGLLRAYRQGRRGYRTVRREPSAENLHEWRKRVKDLWYHCLILERSWKPVMGALADEAHELSDRLGDDHDLAMLLEWAREHGPLDDLEPLEAAVGTARARLQAEALAYGARFYADRPGDFVDRVERWWRTGERALAKSP